MFRKTNFYFDDTAVQNIVRNICVVNCETNLHKRENLDKILPHAHLELDSCTTQILNYHNSKQSHKNKHRYTHLEEKSLTTNTRRIPRCRSLKCIDK